MKGFMAKKWLGAMLALCLIGALAACSGANNGANGENGGKGSPGVSAAPQTTGDGGAAIERKTLTMFVDFPWWPFSDWSGKIPEAISAATGVDIKVTVASDTNQLPLMIASGELPDLVFTYDHISKMSDAKVSYPWQELIDPYTPNFVIDELTKAVNTVSDGNYYTVRDGFSPPSELKKYPKALFRGGGLALREDIMQELGNPDIQSLDDLMNVFATVKEKHPELTTVALTPGQIDSYFRLQHGLPRFGFTKVEGKPAYYIGEPRQIEYYQFMNDLYTKGFITADQYTWKDPNQAKQLALTGKAFAWVYTETAAETLNSELKNNGQPFTFTQVTPMLTDHAALINNNPGWAGVFVTKKSKDPETAIKFIEFMRSDAGTRLGDWGIEGEDYELAEGGYPVFKYNTNDMDVVKQNGFVYWGLLADTYVTQGLARYQPDNQPQSTAAMEAMTKVYQSDPLLGTLVPEVGSDEAVIISNLDNMIKTAEAKIFLAKSREEAQSAYQAMLDQAQQIGLDKLNAWAAVRYEEAQSRIKTE